MDQREATDRANEARALQKLMTAAMPTLMEDQESAVAAAATQGDCGVRAQLQLVREGNVFHIAGIFEPAVDVERGQCEWAPGVLQPLDL
jgi:hypothetical protein